MRVKAPFRVFSCKDKLYVWSLRGIVRAYLALAEGHVNKAVNLKAR